MSRLKAALVGLVLAVLVAACGLFATGPGASAPGLPPDASTAQVTADDIVQALTKAWNASTDVCLGLEDAGTVQTGECAKILLPALQGLKTAAAGVDAWNAGQSGQFACAVADVVGRLEQLSAMLNDLHVAIPKEVVTGLGFALNVEAFCPTPAPDAGAGG